MESKNPEVEVISGNALELMQRAEIDMQVSTAKKYPRPDPSAIKKKMESFATMDEETAESCFYSLPRDGKTIQGPSVRLAEIAVACYGNLRAASRVIANDGRRQRLSGEVAEEPKPVLRVLADVVLRAEAFDLVGGSQAFKEWARKLKPDDAIRILGAAMNDPKLFRALTKSITDEAEMQKAIQVFEPYWVSMQIPLIQSALTQPKEGP